MTTHLQVVNIIEVELRKQSTFSQIHFQYEDTNIHSTEEAIKQKFSRTYHRLDNQQYDNTEGKQN